MVQLQVIEDDPWVIRGTAARLTRDPKPWQEILTASRNYDIEKVAQSQYDLQKLAELKRQGIEKSRKYALKIVEKYEHKIILEFGNRALVIDGISRISALFNWRNINIYNQIYASGLERSLRIQEPPFECIDEKTKELYELGSSAYLYARESGIPAQDARYVLPEGLRTTKILNFPEGSRDILQNLLMHLIGRLKNT